MNLWKKSSSMKAVKQYFIVVSFSVLFNVVLSFQSTDKTSN